VYIWVFQGIIAKAHGLRRVELDYHYASLYEEESLRLGSELAKALNGWIKYSENPEETKQLRIHLARWLKKRNTSRK